MNSRAIFGISLAIVFAIGMTVVSFQTATADHLPTVVKTSIKDQGPNLHVQLKTDTKIPKNGESGLFGYAVLTSGLDNVLAITTHKCAADSPLQSNIPAEACPGVIGLLEALGTGLSNADHDGADWHPHILDLKIADGFCATIAPLEVDLGGTVATGNNVSPTDYDFGVGAKNINVVAPKDAANILGDADGTGVVRFLIGADADGDGNITDLCVIPH